MKQTLLLAALAVLLASSAIQAQVTVYDTFSPAPAAGYGEVNSNRPIFGDALNLAQGGQLQQLGFDLFNTTTGGNSGTILTGNMNIMIYNNTTRIPAVRSRRTNPLIASLNFVLNFGPGGLPAGFFTQITSSALAALNIVLPQNIFITQQFTELTGTSTSNGTISAVRTRLLAAARRTFTSVQVLRLRRFMPSAGATSISSLSRWSSIHRLCRKPAAPWLCAFSPSSVSPPSRSAGAWLGGN